MYCNETSGALEVITNVQNYEVSVRTQKKRKRLSVNIDIPPISTVKTKKSCLRHNASKLGTTKNIQQKCTCKKATFKISKIISSSESECCLTCDSDTEFESNSTSESENINSRIVKNLDGQITLKKQLSNINNDSSNAVARNEVTPTKNKYSVKTFPNSSEKVNGTNSISHTPNEKVYNVKIKNEVTPTKSQSKSQIVSNETRSSSGDKKTPGSNKKARSGTKRQSKLFENSPNSSGFNVSVMDNFLKITPKSRSKSENGASSLNSDNQRLRNLDKISSSVSKM